ncbi:PREDICTED: probable pectinesterase 67 [Ipomoea nil]|uniref:probable pectinesterase 67 n=1 Tax=Ipomoea nil TaxID=35883 RepID=UPI000901B3B1|nr:PREDICTED: probable pectinesterase 67 [Ipomoea nil]
MMNTLLSPLQYLLIFVSLIITPYFLHGFQAKSVIDSPLLTKKIGTNNNVILVVDPNGDGDFQSVQAAIDFVPRGNSNWVIIHVKKGVYREQVHIPGNKPYIFMRGSGRGKTVIAWSHTSADAYSQGRILGFWGPVLNGAPQGMGQPSHNQSSVAAVVAADKAGFYSCGFLSSRNTLFDYKGRHYYNHCYIQGSTDSIFDRGLSMFHGCEIFVVGDKRAEVHSCVTAQHRDSAKEKSGFVFLNGKVYGVGDVYLGRAKGAYSTVVFANTYLSRTVISKGWTNWSHTGHTKHLHHAEYKCHGPGSATKDRAHWSKQLSEEEAAAFLSIGFIQGSEWLPAWL